ncbi:hypothetical protein JDV02_006265 [Purpureocillium takamizusanense]|uniref:Antifungal protein n=1 Tax=Purpureocillium takamizusanense TaxID=2060973 RepID=A0A9Q8VCT7_9HYPO|nr:uncharacterized protein JDV02_006265 [Purpureocillium takamizusanense]UNI20147.1 hypothetical protein JDV02_006265 [Purpureocillium takamizusanense]
MKPSLSAVVYILFAAESVSGRILKRRYYKRNNEEYWAMDGTCDAKTNMCSYRKTCHGGTEFCQFPGERWEKLHFDAKTYHKPCFDGPKERCYRTGDYCNGHGEKHAQTCT